MQLNTEEILGETNEVLETSGITYHRIAETENGQPISAWGDKTANRSLYGYEVDRNFYNLKAEDIKSASWDEEKSSIILERWGRDAIEVKIPRQSGSSEEIKIIVEQHTKQIESLSGQVAELSIKTGNNAALINHLQEEITENQTSIAESNKQISGLTKQTSEMAGQISGLTTEVNKINEFIGNRGEGDSAKTLDEKISEGVVNESEQIFESTDTVEVVKNEETNKISFNIGAIVATMEDEE